MNKHIKSLKPYGLDAVVFESNDNCLVEGSAYNKNCEDLYNLPKIPKGYFYIGTGMLFELNSCDSILSDVSNLGMKNIKRLEARLWNMETNQCGRDGDKNYIAKSTPENIKIFLDLVRKYGKNSSEQKTMNIFETAAQLEKDFEKAVNNDCDIKIHYSNTCSEKHTNLKDGMIKFVFTKTGAILSVGNEKKGEYLYDKRFTTDAYIEFLEKKIKTPFKINGYTGEYNKEEGYWKFGCAKIHKNQIERCYNFLNVTCDQETLTLRGSGLVFMSGIKIGDGYFTSEQIRQMYKLQDQ